MTSFSPLEITFFRGSKTYTFNSEGNFESGQDYTVYLTGTLNWGLAPLHRITQRGPFQDGDSDIDFRLDPRVLSLPIVVPASNIAEHLDLRERLLQVFKPGNDIARLRLSWIVKTRSIGVKVVGGLTMDTDGKDFTIRAVVQLRADNPTWSGTGYVLDISANQFGTPTPYPKPYPVPYGSLGINKITTITYPGSWSTFPTILCAGPATDLTIVDGLGHIIKFDTAIGVGEIIFINLSYGQKIVYDQNSVNRFAYLSINSDLVNWGLFPDPIVLNGTNTISVSATGTNSNSAVIMNYSDKYIGV
jgi:hypothetical protein